MGDQLKIGYARVSTKRQAEDGPSLEYHILRLQQIKCDRISIRCTGSLKDGHARMEPDDVEIAIAQAIAAKAESIELTLEEDKRSPELTEKQAQLADVKRTYNKTGLDALVPVIQNLESEIAQLMQVDAEASVTVSPEVLAQFKQPELFLSLKPSDRRLLYLEVLEKVLIDKRSVASVDLRL